MWIESSVAFPESYTADESWIVRSSDGGQRGDKRAHNFTIKVSFCTIIIRLCHCMISDHEIVVRIFVGLSCELGGLITLYYITRHNFSPTRSVRLHYAAQFFSYQECNYLHYAAQFSPYQGCNYYYWKHANRRCSAKLQLLYLRTNTTL